MLFVEFYLGRRGRKTLKPILTWILIADGAQARVFEFKGPGKPLNLIEGGEFHHINEPSRKLVSTKQGRVFNSPDAMRHAMEFPTDPHEYEKQKFMQELAHFLEERAIKGHFDRLVLVAPPKSLGYIRASLKTHSSSKVYRELAKDLTSLKTQDLPKHLEEILPTGNIHWETNGFSR